MISYKNLILVVKKLKKMENKVICLKIRCKNCGHSWDYKGKSKWYLACPKCKNTININELTEKDRIR